MTRSLIRVGVLVVAGAVVGCGAQPETDQGSFPAEVTAAADALDDAFLEAFNAGDVDALNALYWDSPDVLSFPPDAMVIRGIDEVREANGNFLTAMQGASLEITERHQVPVGNAVVGWGLFTLTMPAPDGGEPIQIMGRYMDVKAERDGRWVYIMDHASVPLPSDAPAEEAEPEAEPAAN